MQVWNGANFYWGPNFFFKKKVMIIICYKSMTALCLVIIDFLGCLGKNLSVEIGQSLCYTWQEKSTKGSRVVWLGIRIVHKEIGDKILEEKGILGQIYNIKRYYQKLNFGG